MIGLTIQAITLCNELPSILDEMKNQGIIDRSHTFERVRSESGTTAEASLRNLVHKLDIEGEDGWRFGLDLSRRLSVYLEDVENDPTVSVITVPTIMRANLPATVSDLTISTRDALTRVTSEAEKELLVLSSYTGPGALDFIGRLLADTTKRGVKVTYISQSPSEEYDPTATLDSLNRLINKYGDPRKFELLYLDLGKEGIMHVKMLIADRRIALIGSANLTGNALFTNIEAGVIVSGRPADIFSRTFMALARGRN